MSLPIKPGHESSEHWRSLRAEIVGIALVLAGLVAALTGAGRDSLVAGGIGVALCAVGAALVGLSAASYAASRGNVKAAAVRRPAEQAPRI